VKNSFVSRLHSRQRRLRKKRGYWRADSKTFYSAGSGNSYLERLKSRQLRLATKKRFRPQQFDKYIGGQKIDVCPRCGTSDGDYRTAYFYERINRFNGRVYGYAMHVHHRNYDRLTQQNVELKCCYVKRNIYEESHGDRLPVDAPVLNHFYLQRDGATVHDKMLYVLPEEYVDHKLKWGYGK